jgi:hypothetical protein
MFQNVHQVSTGHYMVKFSSPNAPSTWLIFLCPHTQASLQNLPPSASSILNVYISCCVITVFVFRKPLFINSSLLYLSMLHEYYITYSVRYYPSIHVPTVGIVTYYITYSVRYYPSIHIPTVGIVMYYITYSVRYYPSIHVTTVGIVMYYITYSVRYYPSIHVTTVGTVMYYPDMGHTCTVQLSNKTHLSTAPAVGMLRANPFTPVVLK